MSYCFMCMFAHSDIFCPIICFYALRSYADDCYDSRIKRCSVDLYLELFVGWWMSYLRYSC
jgi:hypothetical protein